MNYFKQAKKYKVKKSYLTHFLQTYWFIPSDVLQRGIEANIWDLCLFRRPILDIGIGNGKISTFIFRNHPQIDVGIDSDENGLESAKRTKKYRKILHADAENMPFKDASFYTIVSNSTFEHITNDLKAVSEVARVLKNDGLFFITVPSEFLQKWVLEYEEKKNKDTSQENLNKFNKRTNHLHYRSLNNWKKYFQKNNLEMVFYKYYFSQETAMFWYKLFKIFTYTVSKRELWSYIEHSKISHIIPKKVIINLLEKRILGDVYKNAFFTNSENGGQLFMVVQKK